jgi:hypothetical protein
MECNQREWNRTQTDAMHKHLHEKYSKRIAEGAFACAFARANELLRVALENEDARERMIAVSAANHAISIASAVTEQSVIDINEIGAHARRMNQLHQMEQETLTVGEEILYFDAMYPDKKRRASIIGFSNNPRIPLILSNEDPLRTDVPIRRVSSLQPVFRNISEYYYGDNVPRVKASPTKHQILPAPSPSSSKKRGSSSSSPAAAASPPTSPVTSGTSSSSAKKVRNK